MASYLFQVLLLLLSVVFCALCGAGSADSANMSIVLFKEESIDVLRPKGGGVETIYVKNFGLPLLVGVANVMVGLVQTSWPNQKSKILTKYIGTQGDNWGDRAMEGAGKNWEAQWAFKSEEADHVAFAPVAKNNSVYVLSAAKAQSAAQETTNTKTWDFKLTVGTVTDGADATREKKIEWNTQNVSDRFVTDIQDKLQGLSPHDGSAFLMDDGTFFFAVRAWNFTSRKYVFVVAHSKDPNSDFAFTYVNTTAGCYPNFFPWGEQLFMVPKQCPYGNIRDYKLQVSNDMGETWREATGPLAENLDDLRKLRSFFTTITIEGRRVLLFAEESWDLDASQGNLNISLFMADEDHLEEVGLLSSNVETFFGGSFLYTNDELFFSSLGNGDFQTIFICLKEELGKIKRLLSTWYRDDS